MLRQFLLLGAAGALGTLARYGLSGLVQRWAGASFPWGTLAVNAAGSFLFGLVWTLADERLLLSNQTRLLLLTGFMGAFTTFSTFAFESSRLLEDGEWLTASVNLLAQNVLGIAAVLLGLSAGRLL